jgi:hypothetical protein
MASKVVKRFRTQGLLTWLEFRGFHLATQRVNINTRQIAALLPHIRSGKAGEVRFGDSK